MASRRKPFKCKPPEVHFTIRNSVPYNKLLTNLACSSRTGEYWPSVVFVRTSLRSVRTATTSGQYSPVRPSRSVSKRLVLDRALSRMIPHLCLFELENFKAFFSLIINLLLTKLARDPTGKISALGLFCTDLAALGPYCQDLGPIFSQYGPCVWLIRDIYPTSASGILFYLKRPQNNVICT